MTKLIESISFLPDNQQQYLKQLLEVSKEDHAALFIVGKIIDIIVLVERVAENRGKEVLLGAHIVIESNQLYIELNDEQYSKFSRNRGSSHHRKEVIEQKGFDIKGSKADFLVGKNNGEITWMQLEANKLTFKDGIIQGAILFVKHMINYLEYLLSGKNIGPLGRSAHTEKNPIKISKQVFEEYIEQLKKDKSINQII